METPSPTPGVLTSIRYSFDLFSDKETSGSPKLPGAPFENMPCSQTPVVCQLLASTCLTLLPSPPLEGIGFPQPRRAGLSYDHDCNFRGSITQPASLFPPAPDSPCGAYLWGSLPSCWLDFRRVRLGLPASLTGVHYSISRIPPFPRIWAYLGTTSALFGLKIVFV